MVPPVDNITPHIINTREIGYPCLQPGFLCEYELPRWAPLRIGGVELDLSLTKHTVMLMLAATLAALTLIIAARAHGRHQRAGRAPRGVANAIEALVLFLRNEVVLPNVGRHGERFVPFVLTLFFLILFANLLGMVPYGATATSNISVTATLALITFVVVETAGMQALGMGYLNTIVYWPRDMSLAIKLPMTLIMTPIEIVGKLTKPFALAIRLFANMIAGHVVLLALISLIFTFRSFFIAGAPILMAVAISVLDVFVSFLQAFIFALLASVFIGQVRESAH